MILIDFHSHLCFLEHHRLLFAFEASSGSDKSVASCGWWCLTSSVADGDVYLVSTLSPAEVLGITGPLEFHGARRARLHRDKSFVYVSLAHMRPYCPVTFHVQNTGSKVKVLRVSRW